MLLCGLNSFGLTDLRKHSNELQGFKGAEGYLGNIASNDFSSSIVNLLDTSYFSECCEDFWTHPQSGFFLIKKKQLLES